MNTFCTICVEFISTESEISMTPCGHFFHFNCIKNWLENRKSCPQCRKKAFSTQKIPNEKQYYGKEKINSLQSRQEHLSNENEFLKKQLGQLNETGEVLQSVLRNYLDNAKKNIGQLNPVGQLVPAVGTLESVDHSKLVSQLESGGQLDQVEKLMQSIEKFKAALLLLRLMDKSDQDFQDDQTDQDPVRLYPRLDKLELNSSFLQVEPAKQVDLIVTNENNSKPKKVSEMINFFENRK